MSVSYKEGNGDREMSGFTGKKRSVLAMQRELQRARVVLLLPSNCTVSDIRIAFTKLVKDTHPDSAGTCTGGYTLQEMRRAKDILIKDLENDDD